MDSEQNTQGPSADRRWEAMLDSGHRPSLLLRSFFRHLPHEPRCKYCISPFGGFGGKVSSVLGFRPSRMNPNLCSRCLEHMPEGGAETDVAVLFADVRGSTELGERLDPAAFARLMNNFYRAAAQVLISHDGIIDKLIGDEVMALFFKGVSGPAYRQRACDAGLALAKLSTHSGGGADQLPPVGVAVHAGRAFVGNVGGDGIVDFTALGDTVNTAARLQAFARPGELVLSGPLVASLPGFAIDHEQREVEIRGRSEPMSIYVVRTKREPRNR